MRRLGVLGGTFDPIHEGHLCLAREARDRANLDGVVLVPMARPAHREAEATPEQRFHMCRLALAGEKALFLSNAGLADHVRYTFDTLNALRREYPDAAFTLILGADKLPTLPYWFQADKLFAQCDFLCFPRTGVFTTEAMEKARAAGARVTLLPTVCSSCSSTLIRARTAQYEDAPGLAPAVLRYLAENGIYQTDWLPQLRGMMNARRFRHTLGVRQEAVRLAALHGLPVQRAALAGLLHDCAKGMPLSVMAQIAWENQLVRDEDMLSSGAILHGPVGAFIAQTKFGVRDEDVLNAIRSHTVGRPGMSGLELCIFVADATEPGRDDYAGLAQIRHLAEYSLPAAALHSLRLTRLYVERDGRPFFPIACDAERYLETVLTNEERRLLAEAEIVQGG